MLPVRHIDIDIFAARSGMPLYGAIRYYLRR